MHNLTVIETPLSAHWVTVLRDRETKPPQFRQAMANVTRYVFTEAARDIPLREITVRTPLQETTGTVIDTQVVLVPILRAGQGMVDPILEYLPDARVGYLGMYRDEQSLNPVSYYFRLPEIENNSQIYVIDPMLATGGSASLALKLVKEQTRSEYIKFLCIIAAPEGIKRLNDDHPHVRIYTAVLDEQLNEDAFIVPGLGDAGDRQYNTTEKDE